MLNRHLESFAMGALAMLLVLGIGKGALETWRRWRGRRIKRVRWDV